MTIKTLVARIDQLLGPLGFERKGALWNRRRGSVVEVIDVQVSKGRDTATINAGVLQVDAFEKAWGRRLEGFVEEPFCIVRARVGEIVGVHDLWWPLNDGQIPEKVAATLETHVLPFLERSRTQEAMEAYLEAEHGRYPLPKIYLAILKHQVGDVKSACAILRGLHEKVKGGWGSRSVEVAQRLGCAID
ncbi:DUF4304 domain-containing protein [Stenotrophomonas maltophilia]|uniref:DUF4304 domain-containing protein n=1 Tax=Stenotrophomonas maltophilia TaxID=40324 RepID=UPI000C25AF56|nr:DUF4304 domain-containing protein [Stenotrophomonas maltophilia]MBN5141405.1 DUF4304 domain-containing protein [Stenotrophomonas maltophilia]PJL04570.1 hypothetical protein B9Y63_11610 [Stenotrophomonas maltophilia]PJL41876.1 hypothetical protein B9Y56_13940 [Stenotrophomonas maltophilia]